MGGGGHVVTGQGVDSSIVGHVGGGSVGGHVGHDTAVQGVDGGQVVGRIVVGNGGQEVGEGVEGQLQVDVSSEIAWYIYTVCIFLLAHLCMVLDYWTVQGRQTSLLVPEIVKLNTASQLYMM